MKGTSLKADLHVHSRYSKRPSEWVLRKLGCSESYTDPLRLYSIARERGMDLVTITDHNTLAGSLEIAHLENTFVSEEITTYFPEDGCKLHVLAYNLTESHHEDITRLRENVFDLVTYLNQEGIVHALAHPLFPVNERLTPEHFCQLLLLFKNFELNGSRSEYQNSILFEILTSLSKEKMESFANRFYLEPTHAEPWKKNLTAGSDDHSSLNIANKYTEVMGAGSVDEFLEGVGNGEARVGGRAANPRMMAHNLYSIAYQFYKTKFRLDRYVNKEPLLGFADHALIPWRLEEEKGFMDRLRHVMGYHGRSHFFKSAPRTMQDMLFKEAREIISRDPRMNAVVKGWRSHPKEMEDLWFKFLNHLSDKILKQLADSILENLSGGKLFDIFHTLGSAGSLYTMLAPYFVSYALFTRDHRLCGQCRDYVQQKKTIRPKGRLKIAHFTDTFHDVNGVALTLKMQVEMAQKQKKQLTIITCGHETETPGVITFSPIGTFEMPEYPLMQLHYPPLLEMLDYCYEQGFTHIHSATPGPIGLAALAIARIMSLPIYGTYHTALPQYVSQLTEDPSMGELVWKYVGWYYSQMDKVYVPSHATRDELAAKGIKKEKIRFYSRGIDIERFHPSKRNGFLKSRFGVADGNLKFLYVGRVSREKNLDLLADSYRKLAEMRPGIHLVVVGNGPYLAEMKKALNGVPVTFTGFLEGEDLAEAYASGDVFLFPSTTDTFGNVVLEAQASGLPVVVTDQGGPRENLIDGKTGFIVPADAPEAFVRAALKLIDDASLLASMKQHARTYAENRSFESAYSQLWESYRDAGARVQGTLSQN
ncbi:MAG: glycosyltransferase [Thermodesulfobacteriota bacterium]|nr:glycosyltransferase [Thermodesulfobacteriota bacterium]